MLIGKQGANLREIQNKFNVEINIAKAATNNTECTSTRVVTLWGLNEESLALAKAEVEFREEKLKLDEGKFLYLRQKTNFAALAKKCGGISIQGERGEEGCAIGLRGKTTHVEDAKAILEGHLM